MMERRIPCRLTMTSDAGYFFVRAAAFLLLLGGQWSGRGGAVGVAALRLLELKVPEKAELNDNVTLECSFDLGNNGAHLYCVKWYKDGHEFFRFTPDDDPPTKLFPQKGITVDKERLSMTSVGLKNLGWGSSGSYRCEVSTEAPNFETVVSSAVMNVIALPKEDPMAEGFQSAYSVGDMVSGNCTSSKSNPASTLVWFINGKEVDRFSLVYYSPWPDQNGLLTSRLGLSFRVEANHFREAPPTPSHPSSRRRLELRCSANFRDQMRHRVVNTTLNAPPSLSDQRPAKHEGARGGAAKTALSPAIGTALLAFLVASMQASRFLTYTRSGYLPCVSVNLS